MLGVGTWGRFGDYIHVNDQITADQGLPSVEDISMAHDRGRGCKESISMDSYELLARWSIRLDL
jgi:hypothetical protein